MFDKPIKIRGKHATYAKFLCSTSEKKQQEDKRKPANVFARIMDIYMVAPIIGLVYGLRAEEDRDSTDEVEMFGDVVIRERSNLQYIFQLAMLIDNSQKLDTDEKIARAFKNEDEKTNLEIFNSYVRGGIEWLYEQFTHGATTHDEFISKINEIVSNFNEEHFA